jgi:hypothetical protein
VFLEGYRLALEKAISDRRNAFRPVLGNVGPAAASLYPLAKLYAPDGYLGGGTEHDGLAYLNNRARVDNLDDLTYHSAPARSRARPRRFRGVHETLRRGDACARGGKAALRSPRFKSTEDAAMYLGRLRAGRARGSAVAVGISSAADRAAGSRR